MKWFKLFEMFANFFPDIEWVPPLQGIFKHEKTTTFWNVNRIYNIYKYINVFISVFIFRGLQSKPMGKQPFHARVAWIGWGREQPV